jgi:spore coat polysaccharide biosynthesis predicted glycosyltransferase SpsG
VTHPPSILFRCDASAEIGFGHLVRCLALADELHRRAAIPASFALRETSSGSGLVREHGHNVFFLPSVPGDYGAWLAETMRHVNAKILVVDVRDDLSRSQLERVRAAGRLVVLLDDISDRRFAADLAFYPPVPQVAGADWSTFRGERFVGWEWIILRSQFAAPSNRQPSSGRSLLITMGGSDPAGLTLQAVRAVELADSACDPVIVLGSGFQHKSALLELVATARRPFTIRENVSDMRALMIHSDLALCSYGMTAFELAASRVPAIYLCLSADHAQSASALANAGVGLSLGVFSDVRDEVLAQTLSALLADPAHRAQMSEKGPRLIDGHGARRIAELLSARLAHS